MIVVADTSPLNYLVLIDEIDLLHEDGRWPASPSRIEHRTIRSHFSRS
jgi:hypothetical protein